jgi:hypothetical protein
MNIVLGKVAELYLNEYSYLWKIGYRQTMMIWHIKNPLLKGFNLAILILNDVLWLNHMYYFP